MEEKILREEDLRKVLSKAIIACAEDKESTATERLTALTPAIDLYILRLDC